MGVIKSNGLSSLDVLLFMIRIVVVFFGSTLFIGRRPFQNARHTWNGCNARKQTNGAENDNATKSSRKQSGRKGKGGEKARKGRSNALDQTTSKHGKTIHGSTMLQRDCSVGRNSDAGKENESKHSHRGHDNAEIRKHWPRDLVVSSIVVTVVVSLQQESRPRNEQNEGNEEDRTNLDGSV